MAVNAKPAFAYNNLAVAATLTVSTEDASYPKENMQDYRPSTRWKGTGALDQTVQINLGSAQAVTCFGVAGHDMKTQGVTNAKFQYDDSGWQDIVTFTPGNDRAFMKFFAEKNYQNFRLLIPAGYTAPPQIGVIYVGGYLEFPTWVSGEFDPDRQKVISEQNRSLTGQFIGSGVRYRDRVIELRFDRLELDWAQTYLIDDFWENSLGIPFFFAWDRTNHADAVYYMMIWDDELGAPMRAAARSTRMTLRGPREA